MKIKITIGKFIVLIASIILLISLLKIYNVSQKAFIYTCITYISIKLIYLGIEIINKYSINMKR